MARGIGGIFVNSEETGKSQQLQQISSRKNAWYTEKHSLNLAVSVDDPLRPNRECGFIFSQVRTVVHLAIPHIHSIFIPDSLLSLSFLEEQTGCTCVRNDISSDGLFCVFHELDFTQTRLTIAVPSLLLLDLL